MDIWDSEMKDIDNRILDKILQSDNDCIDCGADSCPQPYGKFPAETPNAMAYVPFQQWEKPYDSTAGLSRGTVFPSLDKPFIGEEALRHGN